MAWDDIVIEHVTTGHASDWNGLVAYLKGHAHAGVYLPIAGTAADSQLLDGHDSTYFSPVGHLHSEYAAATHNHDAAYAPIAKGVTNGDAHDHSGGDGAQIAYGGLSGIPSTFAPAGHTASHATGQADALSPADIGAATAGHDHPGTYLPAGTKLDDLAAPDDNTDRNASVTAHGLCPKLDGIATNCLQGDGTWGPKSSSGGGDVSGPASSTDNAVPRFDGIGGKTLQNSLLTVDDLGSPNIPAGQAYKINGTALAAADVGAATAEHSHPGEFAPLTHAGNHAAAGPDSLLPGDIGAATAGHDHAGTYLPVDGTAADAALLDGHDSSYFSQAGHTHAEYAAAIHDHDAAYVSIVATPTAGNLVALTAGGEIADSGTAPADFAAAGHEHAGVYAPAAEGVTGGDLHDHSGGDGAQIAYGGLSGIPETFAPEAHAASHASAGTDPIAPADIGAAASGHNHDTTYAPIAKGVTNGDAHDHSGGDGAQVAYAALSGVPSTFAPSAHKTSHATAGGDALAPSDIGAEPAITTLPIARGGTGTGTAPTSGQVLIGTAAGGYVPAVLTEGTNVTITEGDGSITIAASGSAAAASQVTPAAVTIAHATTDAAAGKTATIDLTANHGMLTRLRFRADFIAGQQVAWSGLVNAANGYAPADTSIAFDGGVGTLTAGDYVKWGEEICLVGGSGTITTPMTLTRAQKGTVAAYHPDNEQMVKCNDGIRLEFYPNSSYLPEERLFSWYGIMTGKWVTAAAISANATVFYTTTDPSVVSDFGFDDLVVIDPAGTPEFKRVAAVFGDVANNTYDKAVFVQGALAAHDNTKDVYRVHQFDVPIPVKFATSATTLYVKMFVDEATPGGTVTGTLEVIADKWS